MINIIWPLKFLVKFRYCYCINRLNSKEEYDNDDYIRQEIYL